VFNYWKSEVIIVIILVLFVVKQNRHARAIYIYVFTFFSLMWYTIHLYCAYGLDYYPFICIYAHTWLLHIIYAYKDFVV